MNTMPARKPHKLVKPLLWITVWVVLICFFVHMGSILVESDSPVPSDAIVVLMGGGPDRILGAADLYREGYSSQIIFAHNLVSGRDEAFAKGISAPDNADLAFSAGSQAGVRNQDMVVLPGPADSTSDEARYVRDYVAEHPEIHSLLLVTSPSHSFRAAMIFRSALRGLDREVTLLSCPTPYNTFDGKQWWKKPGDREQVVMEYMKLINYGLQRLSGRF